MSVPETKELKAEWKTETVLPEYTLKDVAAHNTKGDTWMVIHGQGTSLYTPYAGSTLMFWQSSTSQNTSRITQEVQIS